MRKTKRDKLLIDFIIKYSGRIKKDRYGCWNWLGSKNKYGYGVIRRNKTLVFSHVLSYELFFGNKKLGLVTDHLCRNKSCMNPEHLEAVTQKENMSRGLLFKKKTHCKWGHKLSVENTYVYKHGRQCIKCALIKSKVRQEKRGLTKNLEESRIVID